MHLKRNGLVARGPFIYFIASGKFVKIGWTAGDVGRRLRGIQSNNPNQVWLMAAIEGTREQEAALHVRHMKHWVRGEWFNLAHALYAEIGNIARGPSALIVATTAGTRTRSDEKAKAGKTQRILRQFPSCPEFGPEVETSDQSFSAAQQ